VSRILRELGLATVCSEAHCPNLPECHARGTATFLILGDVCTRSCGFCAIASSPLKKSDCHVAQPPSAVRVLENGASCLGCSRPRAAEPHLQQAAKAAPRPPREDEPQAVAEACERLHLRHVVITSVTRDDLADGGAGHFARTIRAVRERVPGAAVEVLAPDFRGRTEDVDTVLAAGPDIFNHNVETVQRLYATVRPEADYRRSLDVLAYAKERSEKGKVESEKRHHVAQPPPAVRAPEGRGFLPGGSRPRAAEPHLHGGGRLYTKSGLMVGLGETAEEVRAVLADLRGVGCDIVTIGQYLAPSARHLAVARFVEPAEFEAWGREARALGFAAALAGPFVRSSYNAQHVFADAEQRDAGT